MAVATYRSALTNQGTGGASCADIRDRYTVNVGNLYDATLQHNVASIMCGINGTVAADSYAAMLTWIAAAKATGYTVVVLTLVSSQGKDAMRDSLNASIIAGAVANGYTVSDAGADPLMGPDGSWANTTYFQPDGVHPTAAGDAIIAGYLAATLQSLGF